jgi:hypothetical protein
LKVPDWWQRRRWFCSGGFIMDTVHSWFFLHHTQW